MALKALTAVGRCSVSMPIREVDRLTAHEMDRAEGQPPYVWLAVHVWRVASEIRSGEHRHLRQMPLYQAKLLPSPHSLKVATIRGVSVGLGRAGFRSSRPARGEQRCARDRRWWCGGPDRRLRRARLQAAPGFSNLATNRSSSACASRSSMPIVGVPPPASSRDTSGWRNPARPAS